MGNGWACCHGDGAHVWVLLVRLKTAEGELAKMVAQS